MTTNWRQQYYNNNPETLFKDHVFKDVVVASYKFEDRLKTLEMRMNCLQRSHRNQKSVIFGLGLLLLGTWVLLAAVVVL